MHETQTGPQLWKVVWQIYSSMALIHTGQASLTVFLGAILSLHTEAHCLSDTAE